MQLHHQKHHQTYVNGLNAAEEAYAKNLSTREKIGLQPALKFNGGGVLPYTCERREQWHDNTIVLLVCILSFLWWNLMPGVGHINHSLFWKNLAPSSAGGGVLADGPLKKAIESDFGSVDAFKKKFNATTAAIQGSGWGWLVRDIFSYSSIS